MFMRNFLASASKSLLILCVLALGTSAVAARAQLSGATLTGVIADPGKAIIPGATILIKNNGTGLTRTAKANGAGLYNVSDIEPGLYTVTVFQQGFSTFTAKNVQLNVGLTRSLDITLGVGAVTEDVEVSAVAGDVELDTSVVSATVGQRRIVDLPLNGRDWTLLATLQPGVNSVRNQTGTTATNSNRAVRGYGNALTINGHSPYENTYRIDGINENDYSNGSPGSPAGVNLGVDAIQEFSVVTTAYTAEYGRTSGGVINAVTRSGTNTVHGTAFLFDCDKIFDAKNPFDNAALPIPGYHRTQFGGSGGRPIRKDKTFFFTSYEAYHSGQSLNLVSVVPSHTPSWASSLPAR